MDAVNSLSESCDARAEEIKPITILLVAQSNPLYHLVRPPGRFPGPISQRHEASRLADCTEYVAWYLRQRGSSGESPLVTSYFHRSSKRVPRGPPGWSSRVKASEPKASSTMRRPSPPSQTRRDSFPSPGLHPNVLRPPLVHQMHGFVLSSFTGTDDSSTFDQRC